MGASPISRRAICNFFVENSNGLHNRIEQFLDRGDIVTEGELEHILWMEIFNWMRSLDGDSYKFNYLPYRIRSQLYYKDSETYPDLEIWLGEERILVIELKHYHKRTFVLDDVIEDVKKNNRILESGEDTIPMVIFTSSLAHEVFTSYLEKIYENNNFQDKNLVIGLNRGV
jgi:hypothetical protein